MCAIENGIAPRYVKGTLFAYRDQKGTFCVWRENGSEAPEYPAETERLFAIAGDPRDAETQELILLRAREKAVPEDQFSHLFT